MPQSKQHLRFTAAVRLQAGIGLESRAVRLAVPIDRDLTVRRIHHCDVNEIAGGRRLFCSIQVARADEAVAARDPLLRLTFAEDDRVESGAALRLHGDHATAALPAIRQSEPGFE